MKRKNRLLNQINRLLNQELNINICYLCKQFGEYTTTNLQFHHKDQDTKDNRPENILILCKKCHILIHQILTIKHKPFIIKSYFPQETK